jgi:hypothetical protein
MEAKEALLRSSKMIKNDQELQVTLERIDHFQRQITYLRRVETNPANYRLSVKGYLAELDRMYLQVRDYLWLHPDEIDKVAVTV